MRRACSRSADSDARAVAARRTDTRTHKHRDTQTPGTTIPSPLAERAEKVSVGKLFHTRVLKRNVRTAQIQIDAGVSARITCCVGIRTTSLVVGWAMA